MKVILTITLLLILTLLSVVGLTTYTIEAQNVQQGARVPSHPPAERTQAPAIQALPAGAWYTETVDVNGAKCTSLALDEDNHPHIGYGGDSLYYAWHDGLQWHKEKVDDTPISFESASLALDAVTGHPRISYDTTSDYLYDIKYAWHDGTAWHNEVVDSAEIIGYSSLALDAKGQPHISYFVNDQAIVLKYAWRDGTTWYTETVDSDGGGKSSLMLDAYDNPHISYAANGQLRYAQHDGTAWQIEIVDDTSVMDLSLALDAANQPHIGYSNSSQGLKYAWNDNTTWHIEEIETGAWWIFHLSLALDELDRPHISYHDGYPNADLKYTWYDGTTWQIETVDGGENWSHGISLALDEWDQPHISYVDQTGLEYAAKRPPFFMALDKQAAPDDVLHANDTLTFTLSLFSLGSHNRLWDPLPPTVHYVPGSLSSDITPTAVYSPTAHAVVWQGTLPTDTFGSLRFQVRPDITTARALSSPLPITNTAWLTNVEKGVAISATASVSLLPIPLSLEQSAAPQGGLQHDETLTCSLTLSGPGLNVRLWDPLPPSVQYVADISDGSLALPFIYSPTVHAIVWQGTLPTDTVQTIRFQVRPSISNPRALARPLPITNTAWLTNIDSGRSVSATTSVNLMPIPLSIEKRAAPDDELGNGDVLTYSLALYGPGLNVRLWDPLPPSVQYVSGGNNGSLTLNSIYSPTAHAIVWQGRLPTDTVQVIQFQAAQGVSGSGSLTLRLPIVNTAWLTNIESGASVRATAIVNGQRVYLPLAIRNN